MNRVFLIVICIITLRALGSVDAKVPVRNYHHYTYVDRVRLNLSMGPQVYIGGHTDIQYGIKNRLTPAIQFSMYQQFNPYLAYRLKLSGGQFRSVFAQKNSYLEHKFSTIGASADLMLSLNRVFSKKSMEQIPNVWLFAGLGADAVQGSSPKNNGGTFPVFNSGLYVQFPFSKSFDLTAEFKGGVVSDDYNGFKKKDLTIDGLKVNLEGFGSLLVGVAYKF